LVFVRSIGLGGPSEGCEAAARSKLLFEISLGGLGEGSVESKARGSVKSPYVIVEKSFLLVIANVDSVVNALSSITCLEYILPEGIWSVWGISCLVTVPSINISTSNTETDLLSWCSFPDNLGESQGCRLVLVSVGFSSLEVVVLLTIVVPFVSGNIS
jgi:hypothetical protein